MNIGTYTYEEFIQLVTSFHGKPAPGLLIGGLMVDLAFSRLHEGEVFNALCETQKCLPDAIQLLTPCTIGNGRLKILDYGRFAITIYDTASGHGSRAFVDTAKLDAWPVIRNWFLKIKTAQAVDPLELMEEIRKAGHGILSIKDVRIDVNNVLLTKAGAIAICPCCGESYPLHHGEKCRFCTDDSVFIKTGMKN